VRAADGGRLVASATVTAGEHFALAVKPGSYVVSATSGTLACTPTRATVRRGHDLVANLICVAPPATTSTTTTTTTTTS